MTLHVEYYAPEYSDLEKNIENLYSPYNGSIYTTEKKELNYKQSDYDNAVTEWQNYLEASD